jgi:hypothetical protein
VEGGVVGFAATKFENLAASSNAFYMEAGFAGSPDSSAEMSVSLAGASIGAYPVPQNAFQAVIDGACVGDNT